MTMTSKRMFIRFDVAFLIATTFSLILLVRCKIEDVRNEVIPSGGIKSDMNSCNLQKDQNGVQKKFLTLARPQFKLCIFSHQILERY